MGKKDIELKTKTLYAQLEDIKEKTKGVNNCIKCLEAERKAYLPFKDVEIDFDKYDEVIFRILEDNTELTGESYDNYIGEFSDKNVKFKFAFPSFLSLLKDQIIASLKEFVYEKGTTNRAERGAIALFIIDKYLTDLYEVKEIDRQIFEYYKKLYFKYKTSTKQKITDNDMLIEDFEEENSFIS